MRKQRWLFGVLAFLAITAPVLFSGSQARADGPVLVGRISHIDGQLLRFVPEDKDWVATIKDAPFGLDDALYSGDGAKAEFIMPNNTWVRAGAVTQVQLIALKPDVTEIDVASGVVRVYNRSAEAVVKASSPYGYVLAQPGASFDLYVGDASLEVIALSGKVDYVAVNDSAKYEVIPGSSSIVASQDQVASGEGTVDSDWDDWNADRDSLWAKRLEVKGESVNYLPPALEDEAYELEQSGRWETVNYNGESRNLWRPSNVKPGWAPFTVGRWTDYYGDNCWVPDESFGYVTHHYGNWVFVEASNSWFWAPPAAPAVVVGAAPVVGVELGWYPGRVAWIHSGADVGWVPLASNEVYYSHHAWGPAAVTVASVNVGGLNINVGNYRYVNHAVVINQNNFYNVNNYNNVRITNINKTTIINNYRSAPVVNNTVINNYTTNKQRYNFTNAAVTAKPHQTVLARIDRNEQLAKQARTVNARSLEQSVTKAKVATPVAGAKLEKPKVTSRIVPANEVSKPATQVKFQQKELKAKAKPVEGRPAPALMGPGGRAGSPAAKPGQVQPGKPGQPPVPGTPGKPGESVRPTVPGKPGEPAVGKPGQPPVPGTPGKPGESVRPTVPGKPGEPAVGKPSQPPVPGTPGKPGESVRPTVPGRPGEPAVGKPGQPSAPGTSGKPGESVRPTAPGRPGEPAAGKPGQPSVPGTSGKPGESVRPTVPGRTGEAAAPAGRGAAPGDNRNIKAPGRTAPEVSPAQPVKPSRPGQGMEPATSGRPGRPAEEGKSMKSPSEMQRQGTQPGQMRPSASEPARPQMQQQSRPQMQQQPKPQMQEQKKPAMPEQRPQMQQRAPAQQSAPAHMQAPKPGQQPAANGQQPQGEKKKQPGQQPQ